MATKKKRSKLLIFWLNIIISVASLGGFILIENNWKQEVNMYITVANYTQYNASADALYFGTVPPGGVSMRMLFVNNLYKQPINVTVAALGDFSGWTEFSQSHFPLEIGENKTINITVNIPKSAVFANYTGRTLVSFKKT